MPPRGLQSWSDISRRYTHYLILGNGASIAFDARFRYTSLVDQAKIYGFITNRIKRLFNVFGTDDFEAILRHVSDARLVNQELGVQDKKTSAAQGIVRQALIQAIHHTHPPHTEVASKFPDFSTFIAHFHTIVSLNYDLLLYWAHMFANEDQTDVRFKDCFPNGRFREDWRSLRKPIKPSKRSVLVFYPHGNLVLAADDSGHERKIVVDSSLGLLSEIVAKWQNSGWRPLFVSEGSSQSKLATIYQSRYLTTVLEDVLPDASPSVAVFGWSFRNEDDHILDALLTAQPRRVAVSVLSSKPCWRAFRDRVRSKIKEHSARGHIPEIEFFDTLSVPFAHP